MYRRCAFVIVVLMLCAVCATAAKPPVVQYVNIAPLPGAGYALDPEGRPDGLGAMQVNIPVAYTPGSRFANVSAYAGSYDDRFVDQLDNTNGSGVFGMGFGKWPRAYVSAMAVSHRVFTESKALSAQVQVMRETDRTPAVAVGAQDLADKEGDDFSSNSDTGIGYYITATKKLQLADRPLYATAGFGVARFRSRPFVGVSCPISDLYSIAAEYDAYQLNGALGWRPGGRDSAFTVLAGYNGRAGALFGVNMTFELDSIWAIPAALVLRER